MIAPVESWATDLVQDAASNRRSLISDAVGVLAIGVQLYWVVRWLVPDDGSRLSLSVLAFIVLTGLALYFWHKNPPMEHLSSPGEWALAIPASVLIGAVSFGADVFVGMINNPKLPPIEAGTKAGSPFGFLLTVMICPGFTMLAVAGLLRALLLRSGSVWAESKLPVIRFTGTYHEFGYKTWRVRPPLANGKGSLDWRRATLG